MHSGCILLVVRSVTLQASQLLFGHALAHAEHSADSQRNHSGANPKENQCSAGVKQHIDTIGRLFRLMQLLKCLMQSAEQSYCCYRFVKLYVIDNYDAALEIHDCIFYRGYLPGCDAGHVRNADIAFIGVFTAKNVT